MPRIVRSIMTYQNNLRTQGHISANVNEPFYNLSYAKNRGNLKMVNEYGVQPNYVQIPEEKETEHHHTGAKYGASKYTCSLQSGKMHKLIRNTMNQNTMNQNTMNK